MKAIKTVMDKHCIDLAKALDQLAICETIKPGPDKDNLKVWIVVPSSDWNYGLWGFAGLTSSLYQLMTAACGKEGKERENIRFLPIASTDDYVNESENLTVAGYKLKKISKEDWWEMFEILPPMNWCRQQEGLEIFFMSEFFSGNITSEYARDGDNYFTKNVLYNDQKTWISLKQIKELESERK